MGRAGGKGRADVILGLPLLARIKGREKVWGKTEGQARKNTARGTAMTKW